MKYGNHSQLAVAASMALLVSACNSGRGNQTQQPSSANNIAVAAVVNTDRARNISFTLTNKTATFSPQVVNHALRNLYNLNFNLPNTESAQTYQLNGYDQNNTLISQQSIIVPAAPQGKYHIVLQSSDFIPPVFTSSTKDLTSTTAGNVVSIVTPIVRMGLDAIPIAGPFLSAAADIGLGFLGSFLNNDATSYQQQLTYYQKLQTDYTTFKQTLDTTSQLVTQLNASTDNLANVLNLFTLQTMTYTLQDDINAIEGASSTGSTDCSNGGALNSIFNRYNYVQALFLSYGATDQSQFNSALQLNPDLRHALEQNSLSSADMQTLNRCIQGIIPQVTYLNPNINIHPVDKLANLSTDISNYLALNYKTQFAPMNQVLNYTSVLYATEILNTSLALDKANSLITLSKYISDNFSAADPDYTTSAPTSQITVTQAQQIDAISYYYSPTHFGLNSATTAQLNPIQLPSGNYINDCVISSWDGSSQISSSCRLNANEPNLYSPVIAQKYTTSFNDGNMLQYADGILFANDTSQPTGYDYLSQPLGDYPASCKNIVWDATSGVLSADCGNVYNSDKLHSELNYFNNCTPGKTVGNSNGTLVCNQQADITGNIGYADNSVTDPKLIFQHEIYYQPDSAANQPLLPDGTAPRDFTFLASTNGSDTINNSGILLNDLGKNAIGIIQDNNTNAVFELVKTFNSNGSSAMYLRCPGGSGAQKNSECYAGPEDGLGNEVIANGYQYYLYTTTSSKNLATGLQLMRKQKAVNINYTSLITPDSSAESNAQVRINNIAKLTLGAGLMTYNTNGARFIVVNQTDNNLVLYHCTLDNCRIGYPIWASNTVGSSAINVVTILGISSGSGIVLSAMGISALNGALLAVFNPTTGQIGNKALLNCSKGAPFATPLSGSLLQCNQQ